MKFIKKLVEQMTKVDKKVLGRWRIDYCDKVTKTKVDEDHCGPCGNRINEKNLKPTKEINAWTTKQKPLFLESMEDISYSK